MSNPAPSSQRNTASARPHSIPSDRPRLNLTLKPSYSLGPFKLGLSLLHTIDYLRSHQSLFPHINITYDNAAPRLSPIIVSVQPNLYLIFHGVTQRLTMITLDHLDPSPPTDPTCAKPASSNDPSHRPVNLIYQSKVIHSFASTTSRPVLLTRSSLHQILGPTYPGWSQKRIDGFHDVLPCAAQTASPTETYEFFLGYPGVAFSFVKKTLTQDTTVKDTNIDKFQPVSSVHVFCGSDPRDPQDVVIPPSPFPLLSSGPLAGKKSGLILNGHDAFPSNAIQAEQAALDVDTIHIRAPCLLDAVIRPGWGVSLYFNKLPPSRTPSPLPPSHPRSDSQSSQNSSSGSTTHASLQKVDLILGVTTPQDAMCDIGAPQRIFYKEDDRMKIHGSRSNSRRQERSVERGGHTDRDGDERDQSSHDEGSPFFYNYFDVGIDLLFSSHPAAMATNGAVYTAITTGQARLEKIICHTNVAGDALFQRYNRCPWRIVEPNSNPSVKPTKTSKSSASGSHVETGDKKGWQENGEKTSENELLAFTEGFDKIANAGRGNEANGITSLGMELDRGTCAEFRGISFSATSRGGRQGSIEMGESAKSAVQLDLATKLIAREGLVFEVGKDDSVLCVVAF